MHAIDDIFFNDPVNNNVVAIVRQQFLEHLWWKVTFFNTDSNNTSSILIGATVRHYFLKTSLTIG